MRAVCLPSRSSTNIFCLTRHAWDGLPACCSSSDTRFDRWDVSLRAEIEPDFPRRYHQIFLPTLPSTLPETPSVDVLCPMSRCTWTRSRSEERRVGKEGRSRWLPAP